MNGTRDVALLSVAIVVATQIPSTLAAIANPTVRVVAQVFALVVIIAASTYVRPRAVRTAVLSLRPPPKEPPK